LSVALVAWYQEQLRKHRKNKRKLTMTSLRKLRSKKKMSRKIKLIIKMKKIKSEHDSLI